MEQNRQSLFLSILTKQVDDRGTGTAVDFVPKQEEVLNAEEQGLPIFDTRIYNSVRFSRELAQGGVKGVFRCSYLPPAPALRPQTGVDEWVMEVMEKLNLKTENGV